jgi:hypothetical protein
MQLYDISVKFRRKNVRGVEEDSERFKRGWFHSAQDARDTYLEQVKANEPDFIKLYEIEVIPLKIEDDNATTQ